MGQAKIYEGRAIVAYKNGKAVDSEGRVIDGAPAEQENTPADMQPGRGGDTSEDRLAKSIARELAKTRTK